MKNVSFSFQPVIVLKMIARAAIILLLTPHLHALTQLSYQGRVLQPNGSPLTNPSTIFRIQIRSPLPSNCLLFEETQNLNMSNSDGLFSLTLNTDPLKRTDLNTGYDFDRLLSNRSTLTLNPASCGGNNYTPGASDKRRFVAQFSLDGGSTYETAFDNLMSHVPYAVDSQQISGFLASNLLKVDTPSASTTLSPLQFSNLLSLADGTSGSYVANTGNGASLPVFSSTPLSPPAGAVWFDSTTEQLKYSIGTGAPLVLGTGGTSLAYTPVNKAGDSMSGALNLPLNGFSIGTQQLVAHQGRIGVGTLNPSTGSILELHGTGATESSLLLPRDSTLSRPTGINGMIRYNTDLAALETFSNSSWTTLATSSSGATQWTTTGSRISYSGGNVGIGTASPNTLLEMVSPTYAEARLMNPTGGGAEFDVYNYGAGEPAFYVSRSNGTRLSPTYLTSGDGAGYFGWSAAHGTFGSAGRIRMIAAANWSDTSTPGDMALLTTPVGAVLPEERIRILENGNVGIGTTYPGSKLQVDGQFTTHGNAFIGSGDGNFIQLTTNGGIAGSIEFRSGATSVMTIDTGVAPALQRVGIGTTTPAYKLDVQGGDINASGSVRAAGVALTSDRRYKKNIKPLSDALARVLELTGVQYEWRTEEFPERNFSTRRQIGVIAQDVEKVFPELVDTNSKGFKSVNYPALVGPLIEAVRELHDRELDTHSRLRDVEAENQQLKNRLEKIEARLN